MTLAFWVCAGITLISSLVSVGYAVAHARSADVHSRVPSEYALARSIALVIVSIISICAADLGFLAATAAAMVLVQALDAVVGALSRDRLKTVGPALTALANAAALWWMLLS